MELKAFEVAKLIDGVVDGNDNSTINKLSKIESGDKDSLSFLGNSKYNDFLYKSSASIVIVKKSLELKELLIDKGLSQIIKRHFNTRDCIQFSLIENYANEKTDINKANKAFMDIINIQEQWFRRKNKNLSNTT